MQEFIFVYFLLKIIKFLVLRQISCINIFIPGNITTFKIKANLFLHTASDSPVFGLSYFAGFISM